MLENEKHVYEIRSQKKLQWVVFHINRKPNDLGYVVAKVLGKHNPVIVVETRISAWRKPFQWPLYVRRRNIVEIPNGVTYKIWHTPERIPFISPLLRQLNRRRISRDFERLLGQENRVVIYDNPSQQHLVHTLGERVSVYVAYDDLTLTVTGEQIPGELEAECQLLSKVDLVICVSGVLAQRLRDRLNSGTSPPIRVLPNGYDEQLFNPTRGWSKPAALQNIPRPRILVVGYVSERIDWDGIIACSQLRPEWTWVFVGPADNSMKEKIAGRLGESGFYHPPILLQDVPAWISHCDACAVPYRLNQFTLASHPLKAIEYLAMGAPVLSTKIPSLARYDGMIEWVSEGDGESYARALGVLGDQTANDLLRKARRQAVDQDSWARRVDQLKEIVLNECLKCL